MVNAFFDMKILNASIFGSHARFFGQKKGKEFCANFLLYPSGSLGWHHNRVGGYTVLKLLARQCVPDNCRLIAIYNRPNLEI